MSGTDELLTAEQAAARCVPPLRPGDWRSRVHRGSAPAPDVPDVRGSANRSEPRWYASTVDRWNAMRRGRGRPTVDERASYIVIEAVGEAKPWHVIERRSGTVVSRRSTQSYAEQIAARLNGTTEQEADA